MKKTKYIRHGNMSKFFRNGDVVVEVTTLPTKVKKVPARPLALGEVTGHSHRVQVADPQHLNFYEDTEGRLYFKLETEGKLVHEEHKTITLQPGVYRSHIKREYSYFDETLRQVQD